MPVKSLEANTMSGQVSVIVLSVLPGRWWQGRSRPGGESFHSQPSSDWVLVHYQIVHSQSWSRREGWCVGRGGWGEVEEGGCVERGGWGEVEEGGCVERGGWGEVEEGGCVGRGGWGEAEQDHSVALLSFLSLVPCRGASCAGAVQPR